MYVGDAGVLVEPKAAAPAGRVLLWQCRLSDYLFFDADLNYTYARSIDEPEGADATCT
ncbi:MAG: hypothetical protein R2788_10695 [Saprospiraceae bacterium]